jgi:hypothetical protein
MNIPTAPTAPTAGFAPLRLGVHVLVAVTVGVVTLFTALAWPFAMALGMVFGAADARRMRGEADGAAEAFGRSVIALFAVLGMLFFGAIIGGIVAILVVVLAAFSERAAAFASPTDRGVARIVLFLVPVVMWLVVFPLLGVNVDIRIGG